MSGPPPPPAMGPGGQSAGPVYGVQQITPQILRRVLAVMYREGSAGSPPLAQVNRKVAALYPGVYKAVTKPEIDAVEAELKKGPYPTAGMVQFGFEFWFNYFFKEVPARDKLRFAAYVVADDGTLRTEATPPPDRSWAEIFADMLNRGFTAFTAADHITAAQVLDHAARLSDNREHNILQLRGVQVQFRGDGRLPEKIREQGGTVRQTMVESLRIARNMTKPWHPFNAQGHKVWVRRGENGDNCLFSAVSITPQFEVATKFPLLDDLRGSNPAAIGHAVVEVRKSGVASMLTGTAQGSAAARAYQATVLQGNRATETRTLLASQTNIYCVRMRDAYNTQTYQVGSRFPEYAATRISWMDHLLWFAVTRIHFSELDGNAGHLIVITDHRWLQDEALIREVLLNPAGLGHLRSFAQDVVRRGSLTGGVGGIVYTPDGSAPPFEIVSVTTPFVAGPPPVAPVQPQRVVGRVNIPAAFSRGP